MLICSLINLRQEYDNSTTQMKSKFSEMKNNDLIYHPSDEVNLSTIKSTRKNLDFRIKLQLQL